MQRHDQLIQLSNHVKNKLKQHHHPSRAETFSNSSDEFIEINMTDDENELNSPRVRPTEHTTRQRRNTYTTDEVTHSLDPFFTEKKDHSNSNVSFLQEKYATPQQCHQCLRRERIIHLQRQDLIRLYNQNKELHDRLGSSVLLNRRYGNEIEKLKEHLSKVSSHLYEYQANYAHLKQKLLSEKRKSTSKEEDELDEDLAIDHLKRLRDEIQIYNRLVVAKDKQEEKSQMKQIDFLF